MVLLDEVAGAVLALRAPAARGGRRPAPSSTTRRVRGRYRSPGRARRPRRSPCGRTRPSPRRACRRERGRRRRRCRASTARGCARRARRRGRPRRALHAPASFTAPTGRPRRRSSTSRKRRWCSGMLTAPSAIPVRGRSGRERRSRPLRPAGSPARQPPRRARRSAPPATRPASDARSARSMRPSAIDHPGEDLRPAEVDPDDSRAGHPGGYPTSPDGAGREALPRLPGRTHQGQGSGRPGEGASAAPGSPAPPRRSAAPLARRRRRFGLRLGRRLVEAARAGVLLLLLVLDRRVGCHGLPGRPGRRLGREQAPRPRATRAALAKGNGFLCSHPTTILLLGTDSSTVAGRSGDRHSDSIMLLRTDPSHHRLSYLSIPRDLLVPVAGLGNTEDQRRLPGRAARRSRSGRCTTSPGIPIDHVVIVDFNSFKDLIDAEGGITVDVPRQILSNRFDCPYATAQRLPASGRAGASTRASSTWTAQRALIYSRIRENRLDPGENDLTRGARQQAVAAGRDREADVAVDARQAALPGQVADEAARHRPLDRRSCSSSAG